MTDTSDTTKHSEEIEDLPPVVDSESEMTEEEKRKKREEILFPTYDRSIPDFV